MMDAEQELPRDLALGSFDPRWIGQDLELRYGGVRGFRIARIVRFVGIGAAFIAPLFVAHRPDVFEPFFFAFFGTFFASLAGMMENVTHGAYRRGQYLRVEGGLAVRRPGVRGGYRAPGNEAVRVEVDGLLVSEALPRNVVLSRALVIMTTNGFTTIKKLYHVSLVDRALVVRVARFVEKADEARRFGDALAEALGLPRPGELREEESFENSAVGKYGFAFALVGEFFAFPLLGIVAAQLTWFPPVVRAEIAVIAWTVLHFALGRWMCRLGQKQLTTIAVNAFDIEPNEDAMPGAGAS